MTGMHTPSASSLTQRVSSTEPIKLSKQATRQRLPSYICENVAYYQMIPCYTKLITPQPRVRSLSHIPLSRPSVRKTVVCMARGQGSSHRRSQVHHQFHRRISKPPSCLSTYSLREDPTVEVNIAHTHASPSDGATIAAYYHLPSTASPFRPSPLVIIFTGLDGYRTELAVWIQGWHDVGCAVLILEIPGTGDNPGDRTDPKSADRVWSSMFDWIGQQDAIDQRNVICWSFSTGGYYGIRMAHTHARKLKGVVALGGGVHHMFDSEWLDAVNHMEYPFE